MGTLQEESHRCINGCGYLTHDSHDKITDAQRYAWIAGGIIFLSAALLFVVREPEIYILGILSIGYGLFGKAEAEDILYFSCKVCKSGMLNSKSLIDKIGSQKSSILENALLESEIGEKLCPICEEKMKLIPLKFWKEVSHAIDLIAGRRKLELDGCYDCGIFWFDSNEMRSIMSGNKVEMNTKFKGNLTKSSNEYHTNPGIIGGPCGALDCKGKVMYQSKYCYKHRNT